MLKALGHTQQPTSIKTDNKNASNFINKTLKIRRSKSWNVRYFWLLDRYFWLLDRIIQQQFYAYWDKCTNDHGDYYTKHWPENYHQEIRLRYILKGCHTTTIESRWIVSPTRVCSELEHSSDRLSKTQSFMTKNLDMKTIL